MNLIVVYQEGEIQFKILVPDNTGPRGVGAVRNELKDLDTKLAKTGNEYDSSDLRQAIEKLGFTCFTNAYQYHMNP